MAIQFRNELDTLTIANKIRNQIAEMEFNYSLFLRVFQIIQPFNGKQINARIATAIKAALPEYHAYIDKSPMGNSKIVLFRNGQTHHIYLKADTNGKYDHAATVSDNSWLSKTPTYIQSLKDSLISLPQLVAQYNVILQMAKDIVTEADKYNIGSEFDITTNKD